jgi:hypothetical protein
MKSIKILLGAVALALAVPTFSYAAGATATPLAAVTPSTITVTKQVGTSANFLTRFQVVGCTMNPINLAINDNLVATCTIAGLTTSDIVLPVPVSPSTDVATGWCARPIAAGVTAADTLKVRLLNISGIACDMASTEYKFVILRPNPDAD